jgi:hypothetical protein
MIEPYIVHLYLIVITNMACNRVRVGATSNVYIQCLFFDITYCLDYVDCCGVVALELSSSNPNCYWMVLTGVDFYLATATAEIPLAGR